MTVDKRKTVLGLIYVILLLLGLPLYFGRSAYGIGYYEIVLVLTAVTVTVVSVFETGLVSISSLFLICLDLFGLGRIFAYFLGGATYREYNGSFGYFAWSDDTTRKVLLFYLVFLICFYFASFVFNMPARKPRRNLLGKADRALGQQASQLFYYGWLLMQLSFPGVLVIQLAEFINARNVGYIATYISSLDIPAYIRIFRLTFTVGFYCVIAGCWEEKQFNKAAILFFVYETLSVLKGGRAAFVSAFLFLFYFRYRRFGKKPNVVFITAAALIGLPLLSMITIWRSGLSFSGNPFQLYTDFLTSNGVSSNVLAMYLQNKEALSQNTYPYVMEPIVRIFQIAMHPFLATDGQSYQVLAVRFNLSHQLSAHMDIVTYLNGGGLGNNCVAELAEFGAVGIAAGAVLLAQVIRYVEIRMSDSVIVRYLSYFLVTHIFLMPRAEFFVDTYNMAKYLLMLVAIFLVCKVIAMRYRRTTLFSI